MIGDGQLVQHRDIPKGHIHCFVNWVFETEQELMDYTDITGKDLHKVAYVVERDQYFSVVGVDIGAGFIQWKAWLNSALASVDLSWRRASTWLEVYAPAGGAPARLPVASAGYAGLMSGASHTKLASIAYGATANSSDAALRNRANHIGTQPSSTISDFTGAVQALLAVEFLLGKQFRVQAVSYEELPDAVQYMDCMIVVYDGPDGYKPYWSDGTNWVDALGVVLPPYVPPPP